MSWLSQGIKKSVWCNPWTFFADENRFQHRFDTSWKKSIFLKPLERIKKVLPQQGSFETTEAVSMTSAILLWVLLIGVITLLCLLTTASTSVIGMTTLLLVAVVALLLLLRADLRLGKITGLDMVVALFFLSVVISVGFSSYLSASIYGLLKFVVFFASFILFRFVASRHPSGYFLLLITFIVLGFWQSMVGFFQYIHHVQPLATWVDPNTNPELMMTRIFGTIKPSNPNLLAGFLVPCFAVSLGFILWQMSQRRWWMTLLMTLLAGVIMAALVMTGSRGGYLAIMGILAFYFAGIGHLLFHDNTLKAKKTLRWLWLGILITGIVGLTLVVLSSPQLMNRLTSIFAMRADSSISYRLNVYMSVVGMIKDNWLVGIGPGNAVFKQVYGLYMVPGYNALGAYSVPLEVAAEQGVIGLFIFISMFIVAALKTLFYLDSEQSVTSKLFVLLLFVGILGSFIYGLFDTIWYRPSVNLVFWMLMAGLSYFSTLPVQCKNSR